MPADRALPGPDVADLLDRMDRRRRTRRRAVVASVAPAVAVVCALTLTGSPGGTASLDPAHEPPSPTATVTASPADESPSAGPPAATMQPDESPGSMTASPPETPDSDERAGDVPVDDREPAPDEPVTYAFQPKSDHAVACDEWIHGMPDPGPTKWCAAYPGATTFTSGVAAELPIELCRGRYTQAETAYPSADGRWVRAGIHRIDSNGNPISADPRWTWARPAPPGSSITFGAGDCARWTISWAAVDDYGTPLPAGSYRLYLQFPTEDQQDNRSVPNPQFDLIIVS